MCRGGGFEGLPCTNMDGKCGVFGGPSCTCVSNEGGVLGGGPYIWECAVGGLNVVCMTVGVYGVVYMCGGMVGT